ncbi:hypothetical protein AB4Z18_14950 [Leifsonia sp. 2TAF2]|uniref:hypothetical protein n=1 Tax=Leifsonia sp. 2TAF2 TaxID=3233009 RepID=UPI003F988542
MNHTSLGDLEDAQDQESRHARQRIELAEEYIAYYRSRIHQVQESFYSLSAHNGVAEDPHFREELQRVTARVDENVGRVGRKVAELEEDREAMTRRHSEEREKYIAEQRKDQ